MGALFLLLGLGCTAATPDSEDSTATETADPGGYVPGETYHGSENFIEYIPGTLPLVLVAPHGGYETPEDMPDLPEQRGNDSNTQETTRDTAEQLLAQTGQRPHIVINHLHPNKLNPARSREEAAGDDPRAQKAWDEFHAFIEVAKAQIVEDWGAGHYIDVHTNGHDEGWIEVGLGIPGSQLNESDEALSLRCSQSTVAWLCSEGGADFVELVRGETSLGGLLMAAGHLSVPSPALTGPGDGGFFYAGWNTWEHGSNQGGQIDATHLETHWSFMLDEAREDYSADLARALRDFMGAHYGFDV